MKRALLTLVVAALVMVTYGCVYSDYSGYTGHKTTGEAKFWGAEIAFSGVAPDLDGTYSYTAKYDNRGGSQGTVTITSYRNPVIASFSRDGQIDRDGDDIQGNRGILGGRFNTQFVAVDTTGGSPFCEFFANVTQDKSSSGPMAALCGTLEEEVDNDFDLHASFSNLDSLLGSIWSGALTGDFDLRLNAIRLNGVAVPVDFVVGAHAGTLRPGRFSIDLNQAGGAGLIQAILDNTENGVGCSLGLSFDGGLSVDMPAGLKVAFNHDRLYALLP